MEKLRGCVYVLTNLTNGKQYVGQDGSGDPENHRWKYHINAALSGKSKLPIHRAIRKAYRESKGATLGFSGEIVQRCDALEVLNKAETKWIKVLGTLSPKGYNLTTGGGTWKVTECVKRRMSKSMLTHWSDPEKHEAHAASFTTPECKAKMSAAQRVRFDAMTAEEKAIWGKTLSKAQKRSYKNPARVEAARKGQAVRFADEAMRAANAEAHRTPEFIARQSADAVIMWTDKKYRKRQTAARNTEEAHERYSQNAKDWHGDPARNAAWLAAAQSPETCKKVSASLLAHYADPINRIMCKAAHSSDEFRARKSEDTRKFFATMTPEARRAYWHSIHPNGNGRARTPAGASV